MRSRLSIWALGLSLSRSKALKPRDSIFSIMSLRPRMDLSKCTVPVWAKRLMDMEIIPGWIETSCSIVREQLLFNENKIINLILRT